MKIVHEMRTLKWMIMTIIAINLLQLGYEGMIEAEGSRTRSGEVGWSYEIIEQGGSYGPWFGGSMDLEIDGNDGIHVLYQSGGGLNYSYKETDRWIVERVPNSSGIGDYIDMVVDDRSYPHIVHSGFIQSMRYSWKDEEGWHGIDFNGISEGSPTIRVDDEGNTHFAFTQGGLIYSRYDGAQFHHHRLGTGEFYGPSICLDSDMSPRISCSNRSAEELYYYHLERTKWARTVIPEGNGAFTTTQLELDSNDDPQIVYTTRPDHDRIDRVRWMGTGWVHDIVDQNSNSVSFEFEFDNNDVPYVITDAISLWRYVEGSWRENTIDIEDLQGGEDFLEFDSNNVPHLVGSLDSSLMLHATFAPDTEDPFADAGEDIVVDQYARVVFNASGSWDNSGTLDYTWSLQHDGNKILFGISPEFTFQICGIFEVLLTVRDVSGNSDTDTMIVTVLDRNPPQIDEIGDQTYPQYSEVVLNAPSCTDSSGVASYNWTVSRGSTVLRFKGQRNTFTLEEIGEYVVVLSVKDTVGNIAVISYRIYSTDATPPVAVISCRSNLTLGEVLDLDGTGSTDNVGIVNWTWQIDSKDLSTVLYGAQVEFTPGDEGDYSIVLQVTDGSDLTSTDNKTMVVTREEDKDGGNIFGSGLCLFLMILIIGITVLLLIALLIFLLASRRKGERNGSGEPRMVRGYERSEPEVSPALVDESLVSGGRLPTGSEEDLQARDDI